MAEWGFRFTPDDSSKLTALVDELTDAFAHPPDDQDGESARWETKSGIFDLEIATLLKSLEFDGEVLSDGEASGGNVQEWTYEKGERVSVFNVD